LLSKSSIFSPDDARYMARALRLAEHGLNTTHPNPRVGCVLVRNGEIVGEGWHRRAGGPHAEIEALRVAGERARGATAYVTLEPCCHHGRTPPCTEALIAAGVNEVVAAVVDPNPKVAGNGLRMLEAAGVPSRHGLMADSAQRLNRGFCRRMTSGRPWVTSKLAMSLDGRTAMASGESKWITGPEARQDVQRLRARSSAIMTGIETVLADDPSLTVRPAHVGWNDQREFQDSAPTAGVRSRSFQTAESLDETVIRQPTRVVLDSRLRIPAATNLLALPGETWLFTSTGRSLSRPDLAMPGVAIHEVARTDDGRLDLAAVLDRLGQLEINELMVEAGATLNGVLLGRGLVDEWVVYLAPCILGSQGRALFNLPHLHQMADRHDFTLIETRQVGRDVRMTFGRLG
jgi:diaminohydroxyphosphoribosylaminopyrimidine deaminase/5-amino-6-(5-phosphoribosylamino)uracil reductase